jgi:hypothetical protein
MEEIQWVVTLSQSTAAENLTGAVEQVHAMLLEITPNYEAEFAALSNETFVQLQERSELSKHSGLFCSNIDQCSGCHYRAIQYGISHLRGVPRSHGMGPGPGNFCRASCSSQFTIWWCNDVRRASPSPLLHITERYCLTEEPYTILLLAIIQHYHRLSSGDTLGR